jgi:tetratricopeptide (TPR) repeat protein
MFDEIPVRVWLLVAIAAIAYAPARYAFQHMVASRSRRDITQPPVDLSWRTSGNFVRSVSILAGLAGLAVFIFTPAAERFARSPSFWPILFACIGAWAIYTVPMGLVTGAVRPFLNGIHATYSRHEHPRRFWASLIWNAVLGALCLGFAYPMYADELERPLENRCYADRKAYSAQEKLAACNELIANRERSDSDFADLVLARGNAHYRLKNYPRALADYDEAIRLDARDSSSYFNRGLVYEELGDTRRALLNYGEVIRLKPNDPDPYLNRGLIFLDTARFDEAVADFSRARELDKDSIWPLANRGISYAWKRDRVRAENDFKAVRAIDPSNPVLLRGEALLALDGGDPNTAVERLSESLKRDPDNIWALRMRAEVYLQLGETEKSWADSDRVDQLRRERDKVLIARD